MLPIYPGLAPTMSEAEELVILVDGEDRELGFAGKLLAHRLGQRHRAISVCVIDPRGRMLLQRRAEGKYHSGGLWTNACCTHPRPGENTLRTAERRLREELGMACSLRFLQCTHYRAAVGHDLVEDEIVHLFCGDYGGKVEPDPDEVCEIAWLSREDIQSDIRARPDNYTYWFKHYVESLGDPLFDPAPPAARERRLRRSA